MQITIRRRTFNCYNVVLQLVQQNEKQNLKETKGYKQIHKFAKTILNV